MKQKFISFAFHSKNFWNGMNHQI